MNPRTIFSALVLVAAVAAVLVVAAPDLGGGDDGGDGGSASSAAETPGAATAPRPEPAETTRERRTGADNVKPKELPSNPDEIRGTDERSLVRPANLRRALGVLERERVAVGGIFDQLRVAPGRIDVGVDTAKKSRRLQLRADFKISFRTESDFPNDSFPDFPRSGMAAEHVNVRIPMALLRKADSVRPGSTSVRDIDYLVIRRNPIGRSIHYAAYFRDGPAPRIVVREQDGSLRAF